MKKHICRQCGSTFEYCRGCLLSPIPHKDAGFCSKECYEASKIKVEPVVETKEVLIEDVKPIEEEVAVEVKTEATASVETVATTQPTIKKETNTYKKKKNKYKVHE